VSVSPITQDQWLKVFKAFCYVGLSFIIAVVPVWFAKNPALLTLALPINVVLVTLKQLFTPPPSEQPAVDEVMSGVNDLANVVTDTAGKPVTDPNAPR